MCFSMCKPDLLPYYDEEEGRVNDENVNQSTTFIPETIHEHIDSVYLNFDIESDESILAFVYECGNEYFIIWTSEEAMEMCNEPFSEFSDLF